MKVLNQQVSNSTLFNFTHGVDLDCHLFEAEIKVQSAWALHLKMAGYLSDQEERDLQSGLASALDLMRAGEFEWRIEDEDVHMNLERFLTDTIGSAGKKMHLGRSRNDLIASTLKLTVYQHLKSLEAFLCDLIASFTFRAKADAEIIVPGVTHLQNGQPVRYSHILLAHAQGLARDLIKVRTFQKTVMQTLPLGAAALAGTHIKIDLKAVATDLGFQDAAENSYDEVMSRDFMIDALYSLSSIAGHLSRFSEDIILWNSAGFNLVKLSPSWSTGSSIMPNKRNPDVAEICRSRCSHIISALANGQLLLKALPSGYNTDLHELKRVYIQAWNQMESFFCVLPEFVKSIEVKGESAGQLLNKGHILATEITNHLSDNGVSFRDAYKTIVGMIEKSDKTGCQIHQLSYEVVCDIAPEIREEFWQRLDFGFAVEQRCNAGGTSIAGIHRQIENLEVQISN